MSKGKGDSTPPFERFLAATFKPRWGRGHVPSRSDAQPSDYRLNPPRYIRQIPPWVPILRVLFMFGIIAGPITLFALDKPAYPFIMGILVTILVIVLLGIISSESVWKNNAQDKQNEDDEDN